MKVSGAAQMSPSNNDFWYSLLEFRSNICIFELTMIR